MLCPCTLTWKDQKTKTSDSWTSNNVRAGRGRQSNFTWCLFHQILSNHLLSLSIRQRLEQQQSAHCRRPAEQLDIMPFASDFFKSLAFLVHQTAAGAAAISALQEATRATWHHAFCIRFFQITCFPCPSDGCWSSSNQRTAGGQQSNLTSCLLHQIFSNHLLSLSIRRPLEQQQSAHCRRPAEQLDIMPFASDFFKSLAFLVHQTAAGAAAISALQEASRATWHHAFCIRFFQITCFPCPSDGCWSSSNQRTAGGQQSNLTSCLLHQIFSNHLLSLSIRRLLEQQQSAHCRRLAEQLDIMPFASDFFKSLAFLAHQTAAGAAAISALQEASRATWHHAFCIRFFQITCFPCPSDGGWSSSNQRTAGGQQSNLTSCLLHQIFSNHLLSLSIRRRLEQQQSAHCRRPAEQLDIMPFASDFFMSLAFLVHQIPSNDLWGWGNQRENQSGLTSRSNLFSHRDENLYFTWFYNFTSVNFM